MSKLRIAIAAMVVLGILVGGVGGVQATHDNPNWGDDAGNSDQEDCTTGHRNAHSNPNKPVKRGADDCGTKRGNA